MIEPSEPLFHFVSSQSDEAVQACNDLIDHYGQTPMEDALTLVPLGGDGFMIETIHKNLDHKIKDMPIFGMNRGSVGFLMNSYRVEGLLERIQTSNMFDFAPLHTYVTDVHGDTNNFFAINEVSMFRSSGQSAHLNIKVDGTERIAVLVGDGVLVATPAGSTAYNYSAGGSIIPFDSRLLAITPLNNYTPKNWRGAVVPDTLNIDIEVLDHDKRPVSLSADYKSTMNVKKVNIHKSTTIKVPLLYDENHSLSERILNYMFS